MSFWRMGICSAALINCVLVTLPILLSRDFSPLSQDAYASDLYLQVKRAPTDFLPDGELSKAPWKQAQWVEFDHDASGRLHYPEATTRVSSVWTESYIYFAFASRFDTLNVYEKENPAVERWQLWDRDVVEIFLNPQPESMNHYYEFEIAPNNQWVDLEIDKTKTPFNDMSWNSGFAHATRVDSKLHIWTAEMRVPISSMHASAIHSGTVWRANFFRATGKGGDEKRKFLAWSIIPEGKTFHVPARFGILKFVN
jgi:cellulose/xylan binding protein with CBM9 domain